MSPRIDIQVESERCTSCRICELVCSLSHEGVINQEKARIRVTDDYDHSLFRPHLCRLCEEPPCVAACPVDALSQEAESGLIRVDDHVCTGCQACVAACPYEAIWWREEWQRLFVCDRCGGDPTCVPSCTIGTLQIAKE